MAQCVDHQFADDHQRRVLHGLRYQMPAGQDVVKVVAQFLAGAGRRSAAFARAVPFGRVCHHPLLEPAAESTAAEQPSTRDSAPSANPYGRRRQASCPPGDALPGGPQHTAGLSVREPGRWDETPAPIRESGHGSRWEDTPPAPLDGLDRALAAGGTELWTGVTVEGGESFEDLQLSLATSLDGFCRLDGDPDRPGPVRLPKRSGAEAIIVNRSLGCLMVEKREHNEATGTSVWEFGVQAFGEDGKAAADTMATAVHTWNRELRGRATPQLTVRPAGTPDSRLPAGNVVEKGDCRMVVSRPGRDSTAGSAVERGTARGRPDEE
ncbi:hypothetical protein ACGFYF_37345 [Streptomyces lavendulae]|uniref:hypothetical protein n=1 Tax=Streptomyces lavendulae TaxID=1914 RepID=UPI003715BB19